MNTIGQERSGYALEKVLQAGTEKTDKFDSFTAGAATMILQNGFGQTMAFWLQKSKDKKNDKHGRLLEIVREWLDKKGVIKSSDSISFIKSLADVKQEEYLAAQKEALALLEWVKRYANAGL
jgi:CRISPR-associated protein Cmr5